jgi:hypothetical protein
MNKTARACFTAKGVYGMLEKNYRTLCAEEGRVSLTFTSPSFFSSGFILFFLSLMSLMSFEVFITSIDGIGWIEGILIYHHHHSPFFSHHSPCPILHSSNYNLHTIVSTNNKTMTNTPDCPRRIRNQSQSRGNPH